MNGAGAASVEAGLEVQRAERIAISLENPVSGKLEGFVHANRTVRVGDMVGPNGNLGETLALCGAGPSLRSLRFDRNDALWACNSALTYLVGEGVTVSAAVGIDQTPGLLREWLEPPDVPYYVASSCDPELVAHLREHDRAVRFFHNHVGFKGELDEYCSEAWAPGYMVGEGATVVPRAIGLAQWCGFERVDVYGADCALGVDDMAHANGESAAVAFGQPTLMEGQIGGRTWRTRPDMLLAAVDLVRRVRKSEGRVRLMGDTLAVALLGKTDDYLELVMRRLTPDELPPTGD